MEKYKNQKLYLVKASLPDTIMVDGGAVCQNRYVEVTVWGMDKEHARGQFVRHHAPSDYKDGPLTAKLA